MRIELYPHQRKAIEDLKNGAILRGGVGSGKSLTSLFYFFEKECGGKIEGDFVNITMTNPKNLYIITTARKRDELEWDDEMSHLRLSRRANISLFNIQVVVDSWNNIKKYTKVKDAFFILDEQRLVGSGAWVKSFIKIAKQNRWILLSATPGDTWMDYVPVFIANGFYKNRTEFIRNHVVYNRFTKYPKIERYFNKSKLAKYRHDITIEMDYDNTTERNHHYVTVKYDKEKYNKIAKKRWNIYEDEPIKQIAQAIHLMRRVVNSDQSRIDKVKGLINDNNRLIIFYNFNYELDILRDIGYSFDRVCCEWNGHKHDPLPDTKKWIYLVQYTSGAEGWNCTETDAMAFYSQNYSYKIMKQAAGRTDRLNTIYDELQYYHLVSDAPIDIAIRKTTSQKKKFQEKTFKF